MASEAPADFSPAEFKKAAIAHCAADHTRVYTTLLDPSGTHLVATTNDGRVLAWELRKHLVRCARRGLAGARSLAYLLALACAFERVTPSFRVVCRVAALRCVRCVRCVRM